MSIEKQRKRSEEVKGRVHRGEPMFKYCRVVGCGQPTTAGAGKGLNRKFCRRHEDFYERHSSPYKLSYTAAQLAPRRKAALTWVVEHEDDPAVRFAVNAVVDLYVRAGRRVEAFRLAGKPP